IHVEIAICFIFGVEEHNARLAAFSEDIVIDLVIDRGSATGAIRTGNCPNSRVIAAANQILRDHQLVAGIDKDARTRASALAGSAGLRIAHVPDNVVVDLVLLGVHLHMNSGGNAEDIGEYVARDAAIGIATVEPDRVGVADMAYYVAAEQHVLGAVELGPGSFPSAFGVSPSAPLDKVVFNQRVLRTHAADAFNAAVANGVATNDLSHAGLRSWSGIPIAVGDIEPNTVGPLNGVAFDDPVIAASCRH